MEGIVCAWLRNDLRLHDNGVLHQAAVKLTALPVLAGQRVSMKMVRLLVTRISHILPRSPMLERLMSLCHTQDAGRQAAAMASRKDLRVLPVYARF